MHFMNVVTNLFFSTLNTWIIVIIITNNSIEKICMIRKYINDNIPYNIIT